MESKPTLKEKLIKIAHRFTALGVEHRSPDLMATKLKATKDKSLKDISDILETHKEWCWQEVADELKKKYGKDPKRMEAWLDFIKGNKILLRETLKLRRPEDYPEIPKEKWE